MGHKFVDKQELTPEVFRLSAPGFPIPWEYVPIKISILKGLCRKNIKSDFIDNWRWIHGAMMDDDANLSGLFHGHHSIPRVKETLGWKTKSFQDLPDNICRRAI